MHLSIHSECFSPAGHKNRVTEPRRAHFESLIRSMAVLGVATLLGGVTLLTDMAQRSSADAAPRIAAGSGGAAVNLMHREVIAH